MRRSVPSAVTSRPEPNPTRRAGAFCAAALGLLTLSSTEERSAVAERLARAALAAARSEAPGEAYLAFRSRGEKVAAAWCPRDSVVTIVGRRLRAPNASAVDAIEVAIIRDLRPSLTPEGIDDVHRGVRGLELVYPDRIVRWSPTEMLARNLSFARAIEISGGSPRELRVFEADQFLISLGNPPSMTPLFRGSVPVVMGDLGVARVEDAARAMASWLASQLDEEGRLTYKVWPSRGDEAPSNNVLRQFLGTLCLARLGNEAEGLLARNLEYNLARFHEVERRPDGSSIGFLTDEGEVKLGAAAIAALAIHDSRLRARYLRVESGLRAFILESLRPDGSFRTFYRPEGRTGNENFYPGEALVYLATVAVEENDADLLARVESSIRHYRAWHLLHRNPAFVPWHTQACAILFSKTRDPFLASWVFEMNDWLLGVQEWDASPYADLRGRFYDATRPFGPPHASSTAVYLEGLADAWALAREVGDAQRERLYRRAIQRGVRSLLQLQFKDEVDLFYVAHPERARGGIRTTEWDNTVRVDNVAHALLAFMKLTTRGRQVFEIDPLGTDLEPIE